MKTSINRLLAGLLGACLAHGIAQADTVVESLASGQTGKVYFKTVDRKTTGVQLTTGRFQLTDTISGDLMLPSGTGPFPVMVIAHGSGGVTKTHSAWADLFLAKGVGAFIVDSFKERGIQSTANDQSQITYQASTADNLVALKLLATNPRVDNTKIGIIGFSRGGVVALATAFETWRKNVVGTTTKYAVHMPFYGGCPWIADQWDGSPIHHFIGDSDDWGQPVATCKAQSKFLEKAGVPHSLTVYAGAKHGFDLIDAPRDIYMPRAQNAAKCSYIWNLERQVMYSPAESTQTQPVSVASLNSCVTLGATFGPNAKAAEDARARVAKILEETILKR